LGDIDMLKVGVDCLIKMTDTLIVTLR
jgi:hypothetical protein